MGRLFLYCISGIEYVGTAVGIAVQALWAGHGDQKLCGVSRTELSI